MDHLSKKIEHEPICFESKIVNRPRTDTSSQSNLKRKRKRKERRRVVKFHLPLLAANVGRVSSSRRHTTTKIAAILGTMLETVSLLPLTSTNTFCCNLANPVTQARSAYDPHPQRTDTPTESLASSDSSYELSRSSCHSRNGPHRRSSAHARPLRSESDLSVRTGEISIRRKRSPDDPSGRPSIETDQRPIAHDVPHHDGTPHFRSTTRFSTRLKSGFCKRSRLCSAS